MKRIYILFAMLLFGSYGLFAQEKTDCAVTLSLERDYLLSGKFDEALTYWEKLHKECPKHNEAIFADGTKIFKNKFSTAHKAKEKEKEKESMDMLLKLYDEWLSVYPDSKHKSQILHDKGIALINAKLTGLKEMDYDELYNIFSESYQMNPDKFVSPKAIRWYFDAAIYRYKQGKLNFNDLINLYDKLMESIDNLSEKYTKKMETLQKKEEAGELMKKEEKKLKDVKSYVVKYAKNKNKLDKKLEKIADCPNLVLLYNKNYELNKDNPTWLRKAARNLSNKNCSNDPIFEKLVVQLDKLEPTFSSKKYLGILYEKKGQISKAIDYYKEAVNMADKAYEKAKIYFKLASIAKKRGQKSQARSYAYKALEYKPSMGSAYILIAQLIASSANDCGSDEFEKRATYWLAANMADKAARVDPTKAKLAKKLAASYRGKAPTKTDAFQRNMFGKSVQMKCWVGGSVKVPY